MYHGSGCRSSLMLDAFNFFYFRMLLRIILNCNVISRSNRPTDDHAGVKEYPLCHHRVSVPNALVVRPTNYYQWCATRGRCLLY